MKGIQGVRIVVKSDYILRVKVKFFVAFREMFGADEIEVKLETHLISRSF